MSGQQVRVHSTVPAPVAGCRVVASSVVTLLVVILAAGQSSPVAAQSETAGTASGAATTAAGVAPAGATSCVICHADPEMIDDEQMRGIVERFRGDVHAEVGLSCHDCHGGNPDRGLADDLSAAMDPDFAAHPYQDPPDARQVPGFCGRCHSDPNYMRRFRPDARVDQEREYWTSRHGQSLRAGDTNVATCIDCHGVHGIVRSTDTRSPVYPKQVAATCNNCHGDAQRMGEYTQADGSPLPHDQYARWRRSVHATALLDKEDLSAPTCNDCHGNHGATPPGLESVGFVCGQCHGREAALFRASPKHAGFVEHNEVHLPEMGKDGCAACHEAPEPAASQSITALLECSACHGNHGIVRATMAQLAPAADTPCAMCHERPAADGRREPEKSWPRYRERLDALLAEAAADGLAGDDLYDWLVEAALHLPPHTAGGAGDAGAGDGATQRPELRPEFARLFHRFRIGKTFFTYPDPVTQEEVEQSLVRCTDCHGGDDASGSLEVARQLMEHHRELTVLIAEAERVLLGARRGGVEVGEAQLELDRAVDAEIELQVLVHGFSAADGGPFSLKHAEGVEHARAALTMGETALDELGFRRQGLVISLVFVLLVLVGLGLKIRELAPEAEDRAAR